MLNLKDIIKKLENLENWQLSGNSIEKEFVFDNFSDCIKFVNKIAELSGRYNHHPDIIISRNKLKLMLSSYSEGGVNLTEKDIELAEEINKIEIG